MSYPRWEVEVVGANDLHGVDWYETIVVAGHPYQVLGAVLTSPGGDPYQLCRPGIAMLGPDNVVHAVYAQHFPGVYDVVSVCGHHPWPDYLPEGRIRLVSDCQPDLWPEDGGEAP